VTHPDGTQRDGDQKPHHHDAAHLPDSPAPPGASGQSISPVAREISARELAGFFDDGRPIQIMDVRAPERVSRSRIDLVPPDRFHNIRGSQLIQHTSLEATGLDPDLPVALVCGHGEDSRVLARHLERMGLDARSLTGGMVAWMRVIVPRELDPPEGLHRLVQFDRMGKGCLGYLLASAGEAIIVDPPIRFDTYLEVLEATGARLTGVADTHVHADYVSGGPELARRFGVPYYLHPSDAVYPYDGRTGPVSFRPLSDGDTIELGDTALRVMHTPGHTEGSVTYLLEDRVALTGDFLFVESVGRPDLAGKELAWGQDLWSSLARAIREWGDGLAVYPAHYAAETERRMGRAVGSPFGSLLRENEILRIQDPEVFYHEILLRKASFPEAYQKIKAINVGLAPVVESEVEELEVGRNECALGGA
jgi:glyoxylase-like metal-dependent hydrolase (beta-lactamase superfamily II)